jgi:hypothetical protein
MWYITPWVEWGEGSNLAKAKARGPKSPEVR